ncbi:hypothetical protein [Acidocella aquatica]|nr:hypothetical protein [Acidocella aquatica]
MSTATHTEVPVTVMGDQLGLAFPPTIERLREQGVGFLTAAFHASGVLPADNQVTAITGWTEFFGGGMGRKLLLSVAYARPDPALRNDLFVKFPRDFGDPLRALFGPLMEPEIRFSLLSRQEGFPIAVPRCYFADYNAQTASGILITERIAYGTGGIEPCHDKCLDYELGDPLAHYQALTETMARLAAYHKAGKFGAEAARQFPFDPDKIDIGSRIPYTPEQLHGKLDKLRAFAAAAPQLFQDGLEGEAFLAAFCAQAPLVLAHELEIRRYLNAQSDYIALCHWNMNLDNAWFWADAEGVHAGLLDWGSVGQMNLAQAFYGMTCAAETGFLNTHRRGLMERFAASYRAHGGPQIDAEELRFMVKLAVAVLGIAWILDAPALVEGEIADYAALTGRSDPRLKNNFLARAQLQLLIVFLNEWREEDIGGALRAFIARTQESEASAATL